MKTQIVCYVGEAYKEYEGNYYAKPTSVAFLQDLVGRENVCVASPSSAVDDKPDGYSSYVEGSRFYSFPPYSSTKEFILKCIFKKGYLKSCVVLSDQIIAQHKKALFWVRTPSAGSILFALRVLKARRCLLNHICADATHTWRDKKYGFSEKIFGLVAGYLIRFLLGRLCASPYSLNLCTGDVLENFSRNFAPTRTAQFVDVMVKQVEVANSPLAEGQFGSPLRLLFVGRVVADKGIFDLVEALRSVGAGVELTVVGDGPDREKLENIIKNSKLDGRVHLVGQLPHGELSSLYAGSDLVVVPSNNYYEGFPRVIMEAWAHGRPVIVSRVGGIGAFVRPGDNGLVYDKGDIGALAKLIIRCMREPNLLAVLSHGALKMTEVSTQGYWLRQLEYQIENFRKVCDAQNKSSV